MGLFDKLFNSNSASTAVAYTPKNEQEAWVAIMYSCMATDGDVSEIEVDKLVNFLVFKTMFKGHNVIEDLYKPAMRAQKQIGSKEVIDRSVSSIKEESKPTLFALVMEILLADGILGSDEQEIAEYLTNALSLNQEIAQKIVEVMLIKNQGNIVLAD
jgi:uncharacterized tellurite resistance protein B-like protein